MRVLLVAALLLGGCARNAIFELELDLPPDPSGIRYAVVQARDDADFSADWSAVAMVQGVRLQPACSRPDPSPACDDRALDPTCSAVVSVVGDEDDLTRPLRVRIRFCEDPACAAAADASSPETRVELERAFYTGRYTQGRVCVDAVPPVPVGEPIRIERCEVRCRKGDAVMHCRADGTHFCEPPL